jgi:hypothetical protein
MILIVMIKRFGGDDIDGGADVSAVEFVAVDVAARDLTSVDVAAVD